MSNADRRVDAANLKGYHISPQILEMELLTPKKVAVGDTVKVRVLTRSKAPVNPNNLMYEGPDGRETRMSLRMARAISSEERDDGMVYETWEATGTVPPYQVGGVYFPLAIQNLNNQLGHGKSFRSDYHPIMDKMTARRNAVGICGSKMIAACILMSAILSTFSAAATRDSRGLASRPTPTEANAFTI